MVKLVTAAELKPFVKLSSSCWVRLCGGTYRGGVSSDLIRLGPVEGYNCDLFLEQVCPIIQRTELRL